ncbi:GGDEF domain-containing protein [Bacillus sp. CGMCC 1.16607]|uniref:GGDEF domain-containing protein n=1 Tax=Bacillus sp. CGMCC 1.16607 TaxID=3351842 RepID=UPI00363CF2F5
MIKSLFTNMAYIISFTFIIAKLKDVLSSYLIQFRYVKPLLIGIFSVIIMQEQITMNGMVFDLRCVPLLWLSLLRGWKMGFLAAVFPLIYRLNMGGPTVLIGTVVTIILPVIIGALFHEKEQAHEKFKRLNLNRVILSSSIYFLLNYILGVLTLELLAMDWLEISFFMLICGMLSIIAITLIMNDDSNVKIRRNELIQLSTYDDKTQLLNFRTFLDLVDKKVMNGMNGYILMIDIDHFKMYNDTYGHTAGDEIIRKIGEILKSSISEKDLAGRFGGEEFIVFLQTNSKADVILFIKKIKTKLKEAEFEGASTQPIGQITVSIGVSQSTHHIHEMLEQADKALYQSKHEGRCRFTFYNFKKTMRMT